MNLKINYANNNTDPQINKYIEAQLSNLNKYRNFHENDRINVYIESYRENAYNIKMHIFLQHHHEITADATTKDMQVGVDKVIKKLAKQLKTLKNKQVAHH